MKNLLNTTILSLLCLKLLACDNQTKNPTTSPKAKQQILASTISPIAQKTEENQGLDYEQFAKIMANKQHLTCTQDTDCQVVTSLPCGMVGVVNKQYQQAYSDYNAMLERGVDCLPPTEQVTDFQAKCSLQQCQLVHQ